jgi:hypothetical protein
MDSIKSHCYVVYSSPDGAKRTHTATYRREWPLRCNSIMLPKYVTVEEAHAIIEAKGNIILRTNSVPRSGTPSPVGREFVRDAVGPPHHAMDSAAMGAAAAAAADAMMAVDDSPSGGGGAILVEGGMLEEGGAAAGVAAQEATPADVGEIFTLTKAMPNIYWIALPEEEVEARRAAEAAKRLADQKAAAAVAAAKASAKAEAEARKRDEPEGKGDEGVRGRAESREKGGDKESPQRERENGARERSPVEDRQGGRGEGRDGSRDVSPEQERPQQMSRGDAAERRSPEAPPQREKRDRDAKAPRDADSREEKEERRCGRESTGGSPHRKVRESPTGHRDDWKPSSRRDGAAKGPPQEESLPRRDVRLKREEPPEEREASPLPEGPARGSGCDRKPSGRRDRGEEGRREDSQPQRVAQERAPKEREASPIPGPPPKPAHVGARHSASPSPLGKLSRSSVSPQRAPKRGRAESRSASPEPPVRKKEDRRSDKTSRSRKQADADNGGSPPRNSRRAPSRSPDRKRQARRDRRSPSPRRGRRGSPRRRRRSDSY